MALTIPPTYLDQIKRFYPDLALTNLVFNQDGMVNDVVIVNHERVFRFPKHDWAQEHLLHEYKVLELVARYVDVPIPRYDYVEATVGSYAYLPGVPLTRDRLLGFSPAGHQTLIQQLGQFLHDLHHIPVAEATAIGLEPSLTNRARDWYLNFFEEIKTHIYPYLIRPQITVIDSWFAPVQSGELRFEHDPVLVNGDVGASHVLVDPATEQLTGIIDFGTVGLGDPAVDLSILLNTYGESLIEPALATYPALADLLPRARFRASLLELQWALAGVKGDKELALAHLGGARDLMPLMDT